MVLYVQETGAIIQRRGGGLEVRKQGALLYRVPLVGLDRLVVIGVVQVTTQALYALSAQGIDVVYLSANGRMRCTVYAQKTDNVFLRMAQYQRAMDAAYRLAFAKALVQAKMTTQIKQIRAQRLDDAYDWQAAIERIAQLGASVSQCDTIDGLRGLEGSASRIYFECFGAGMKKLPFTGRSRRPAREPSNALLNLGYAFLSNECIALLDAGGLDCGLGFMHGVVYGRKSLALDIMEPFRAETVDRVVLRICNWGMIEEKDFVEDAQTGFRLTPEGFRTFVAQYEKHVMDGERPLRTALRDEVGKLRHALLEGSSFSPWEGD
ncbi:MAG: CRISPR-associated endonuclease Cas1 [Oscillospiraceae bacterium]|jgi:CRISPR-associated protein Cas1|nr:CRISPR-associated endonuclease Cas1 [Oscillospiraceae bacterium]